MLAVTVVLRRSANIVALAVCLASCGRVKSESRAATGTDGSTAVAAAAGASSGGGPSTGDAGTSGSTMSDAGATSVNSCGASLASARITLLTDAQWKNVVRDVLGVDIQDDISAPQLNYYTLDENAAVGAGNLRGYLDAADKVAALLKPCGADIANASCVEAFLRTKLPLAWRRPVTDAEIASLMALFNQGYQSGAAYGVKSVTRAMLLASSFLYRSEIGADASMPGVSITLNPYELASAVSFAFLDSVADAELWSKAEDGSLTKPEVLSAQADRLLAVPAVQDNLRKKVSYYLKLELPAYSGCQYLRRLLRRRQVRRPLHLCTRAASASWTRWFGMAASPICSPRTRCVPTMRCRSSTAYQTVAGDQLVPLDMTNDTRSAGILSQPSFLVANGGQSQGSRSPSSRPVRLSCVRLRGDQRHTTCGRGNSL